LWASIKIFFWLHQTPSKWLPIALGIAWTMNYSTRIHRGFDEFLSWVTFLIALYLWAHIWIIAS
jgi:hypothetical protein